MSALTKTRDNELTPAELVEEKDNKKSHDVKTVRGYILTLLWVNENTITLTLIDKRKGKASDKHLNRVQYIRTPEFEGIYNRVWNKLTPFIVDYAKSFAYRTNVEEGLGTAVVAVEAGTKDVASLRDDFAHAVLMEALQRLQGDTRSTVVDINEFHYRAWLRGYIIPEVTRKDKTNPSKMSRHTYEKLMKEFKKNLELAGELAADGKLTADQKIEFAKLGTIIESYDKLMEAGEIPDHAARNIPTYTDWDKLLSCLPKKQFDIIILMYVHRVVSNLTDAAEVLGLEYRTVAREHRRALSALEQNKEVITDLFETAAVA
jgi:hypothetical protein